MQDGQPVVRKVYEGLTNGFLQVAQIKIKRLLADIFFAYKSIPKGQRPIRLHFCKATIAPWAGFEMKWPKKVHNGSENSETQKKSDW